MLTSTVWTFYPIVVFLGRAQCHLISKNTEDCLLCLLDMSAKLDSNPNPQQLFLGFLDSRRQLCGRRVRSLCPMRVCFETLCDALRIER